MKQIRVENPGLGYRLALAEGPTPRAREDEVLIRVVAAGVNRADILQARGQYPPPTGASDIPGMEVSGEIADIGDAITGWRIGDRVCALLAGGGYAEYCTAPAETLLPVSKSVGLTDAAALPEAYFTVWANLYMAAHLRPNESVLIHGGSSGIGTAAIQLCAALGHEVFTTAGSPEKCARCVALGAHRAINYREEDFVAVIREEVIKGGVDVILDMVGGEYIQRNIEAAAPWGRIVNIAYQAGAKATVNFAPVLTKRLSLMATTLRSRSHSEKREIRDALLKNVWPHIQTGKIKPVVDRIFPIDKAQAAHARMISSEHVGKILLAL